LKTLLITGGCGFIGSHFIKLMLRDRPQYRVVNLDLLTYAGNPENLSSEKRTQDTSAYRFVRGDIAARDLVEGILKEEKPWAVVNFAAESHVDRSVLDSSQFIHTNIGGVQALLEASRRYPVTRFIHISTDEVYGDKEGKDPSTEEAPLIPSSPYAASKAAADLLCFSYRRTYGMPIIITRSSNNYGPYQFPEKLIPLLIRNALTGLKLPVYGDGRQVRDWLYVEDNCQGILTALEKGNPGSTYNIGTGEERTNHEVVEAICEVITQQTGADLGELKQKIEFVSDRPGHDRRYAINTSRIRTKLRWSARVDFDAGLKQTVRWYLDHSDWMSCVASPEYRSYYESVYSKAWGQTR
jgi:dTDP-glucose 4,6-dehydratase